MSQISQDSFKTRSTLTVGDQQYEYYSLPKLEAAGLNGIAKLPNSLKVLLENLLRFEDGNTVTQDDIKALQSWTKKKKSQHEIAYRPARVLMQDFTGVPAIVDLAAMRAAMVTLGGDPERINPLNPVDLVIDHSVQVYDFATSSALSVNTEIEIKQNRERYEFLRWGQTAFDNFRVVPPGTGICHQVNLEYLAKTVWTDTINGRKIAYPDTLVGTDSHTTMINGLGVLGWGVGGIEAEAAMLGQPISMLIPEVIGFQFTGKLNEGITATDLVLTVTQLLRQKGVVGKFVEFFGSGLNDLALADRATIANMAPEYGATCGYFPIDQVTLDYLALSGRSEENIALVKAYAEAQGMWRDDLTPDPIFTDVLSLDLSTVEPSVAGPKRPQDKVKLSDLNEVFNQFLEEQNKDKSKDQAFPVEGTDYELYHGDVVIAAITSCTNTSNPSVLMAAGLVAKKAYELGLTRKPWVKSSLAPGSKVVTEYLQKAGLQDYLDELGFQLVGYGCTTCIGNSGPLPDEIAATITEHDVLVSSVLSGNRNFEGRVHPQVKANWLASPPLVVAFALAGTTRINLNTDSLGNDKNGNPVFLRDIWPSNHEIAQAVALVEAQMFRNEYADVFTGNADWQSLSSTKSITYQWKEASSYVQHPPYFEGMTKIPAAIKNISHARVLALLGDSITTDHISPAGSIKPASPAGEYLLSHGITKEEFNSYGARRGNHEVMVRGTFANIRIRNEMLPEIEGGYTKHMPSGETLSIYDAAMRYKEKQTPLVIFAGKEYGTGSSRDWAAKGTLLLGVKAVIAESFERIHRSNLIGMGIIPLQFKSGETRKSLGLTGSEQIDIVGLESMSPGEKLKMVITREDGSKQTVKVVSRIDTVNELLYYQHGGILQYVLRKMS